MKKLLFTFLALSTFYPVIAQSGYVNDPGLFQTRYISPQKIIQKGPGHYFFDFGKAYFGTLSLTIKSPQSDSLAIHLGEKLSDQNNIDRDPGGTIRYQKIILPEIPVNRQFLVELSPDGRNDRYPAIALPDSFGILMPFRYCEIENLKLPLEDIEVAQKIFHYRFDDDASYFTSSDTILNQVWEICKHTIKATSFCGIYIDGDRERIPYEADAFINQLSHYCIDNEYTLAQRTNEYFINHPTWPTEWILHTVLLFYYDYLYSGNTRLISEYYSALKNKTLTKLENKDGLISTDSPGLTDELMKDIGFSNTDIRIKDIVDWPAGERDGYEMTGINTVVNSFYYLNLRLISEIAKVLGKNEDYELFYNKSNLLKNTINNRLLDDKTGIYIDGEGSKHSSLHANMFPLAFGIAPEKNTDRIVSFIKSRKMACSVYGAQFLLEALYKAGEADYALDLMRATEGDRNWWNMIRSGSTITLEAWDKKYKPNLDWNHAWGTAPANIITRYLWGITPGSPGFGSVKIMPQLSQLTYSRIKVPTLKGPIYAEFKKINNNSKSFTINLPAGTEGEFILIDTECSKILLNNKAIKTESGLIPLKEGRNQIEIRNQKEP